MNAEHWIVGPQLIGMILLVIGFIQKRFPPKHINPLYGYRMPSAMKNQQTWEEANKYAAIFMMKSGIILILAGVTFSVTLGVINMQDEIRMLISAMTLIVVSIGSGVVLIVYTEKHLQRKFDSEY